MAHGSERGVTVMLGCKLAACVVTLLVSLVLPVALPIVLSGKYRGEGLWKAWLVGAVGFFVPQVVVRLPILSYLGTRADFLNFAQKHLLVYALGLAFTAGLFELSGRYAGARLLRKNLTFRRAVVMGLGHGGIEAVILTGLSYVSNIAFLVTMMTGSLDAQIASLTAAGTDASHLIAMRETVLSTGAGLFLLAGLERVLAMTCHTCMTTMVCFGVAKGKAGKMALGCLTIHFLLDSTVAFSLLMENQTLAYGIIYSLLIVITMVCLWILRKLSAHWKEETIDVQ